MAFHCFRADFHFQRLDWRVSTPAKDGIDSLYGQIMNSIH
jgi:hypothetical protein